MVIVVVGVMEGDAIVTPSTFFQGVHGTKAEGDFDRFDLGWFVHEDGGGG